MKTFRIHLATYCFITAFTNTVSAQDALRTLSPLFVRSSPTPWLGSSDESILSSNRLRHGDTAAMLRNRPGAAIVRNGAQTGILQLRGLSGDRVGVVVDGMTITPACPNHMDPPLHYAHPASGDQLELMVGISPVSAGGDRIGGTLRVHSAEPEFSTGEPPSTKGSLGAAFHGNQNASLLNLALSNSSEDRFFRYRGSAATADDLRYPGGKVSASGYDTTKHDLTAAWRSSGGFIAFDFGLSATRDAGTPTLAMDMVADDSWRLGLTQKEEFDWGVLENRLFVHDIDHLMDNFTLRPVMPGGMAMESPAVSRDYGWIGAVTLPQGEQTLRAGVDIHRNEFAAQQIVASGMMAGARRDTFADNTRSRFGTYLEWEQKHSSQWRSRYGLRGDLVSSDADTVKNAILPPPGAMRDAIIADQARFNAADRSFTDLLPAATAALRFEPDQQNSVELAIALQSRAPSLVERYLWTPLNASAGLADGRSYLGNLRLDPETSFQLALAMNHENESWKLGITPFYQSVNDYIQGMPITRMANGQPVLQYDNIDRAELYGFELTNGWQINESFTLDSSLSYVRGRNLENGEDLYRIAPFNGMFDLGYRDARWAANLEWVWAAAQNHVSDLQNEQASPGYGILNLRVARSFAESVQVEVGVENLLDKRYHDHLGGVNRVIGGDLLVGQRIPAAARFAYLSVDWKF